MICEDLLDGSRTNAEPELLHEKFEILYRNNFTSAVSARASCVRIILIFVGINQCPLLYVLYSESVSSYYTGVHDLDFDIKYNPTNIQRKP